MSYSFMRWVRAGAAGAAEGEEGVSRPELRAEMSVELSVTGISGAVEKSLMLYGPGDVVGLDRDQVIRCVPEHGALAAEVGVFPHVEFDDPDLPWRYTPFQERVTPDANAAVLMRHGTLTPWLSLIVVEDRQGVTLQRGSDDLLPVLTLDAGAANELPKADEIHAWAHAQVFGALPASDAEITSLLANEPTRVLSRLVCPRLLEPEKPYIACIVPVFEAGRQAGLGQDITAGPDDRAWPFTTDPRLPVYFSWSFKTGPAGDFETLVRRLGAVQLDELVDEAGEPLPIGRRPLDISSPGFGVSGWPQATLDVLGALCIEGSSPLTDVDEAISTAMETAADVSDQVAPPLYGRWHAAIPVPKAPGDDWPVWFESLNLHPGMRVAAGLGSRVVQDRQEEFMEACWNQVGDILRANQLLRQAQLGLAASTEVHRRYIQPLTSIVSLQVLAPTLSRLRSHDNVSQTLWAELSTTCLPAITVSAAWRRATRRGPLRRRVDRWLFDEMSPKALDAGTAPPTYEADELVLRLAGGDRVGPSAAPGLARTLRWSSLRRRPRPAHRPKVKRDSDLTALRQTLDQLWERSRSSHRCTPPDVDDLAARARLRVDPAATVPRRVRAQLHTRPGMWDPAFRIDPILASPEIHAPMYGEVIKLGQDWLLPGVQYVPPESVCGLSTNQTLVEAFMVGMNHEMSRELLWRGFPTDQRGSVFRQFWDESGAAAPPAGTITRIHTWSPDGALGTHQARPGPAADQFVLLLRGELLRRFPRVTIFLVKARWKTGDKLREPVAIDATSIQLPLFTGRLDPDLTFFGFASSADEVRGNDDSTLSAPGYFVVFQEQPTEPQFWLAGGSGELDANSGGYVSWADLGVGDIVTAGGHVDLEHTTTAAFLAKAPSITATPAWDGRSDTLAAIFLRKPFRLFLHGSDLLPNV